MEAVLSKITNAMAFNRTQFQYQFIEAADNIALNFQLYVTEIKRWISDYAEVFFWKLDSTSNVIGIFAAVVVGFIIAATSKLLSGRRRSDYQAPIGITTRHTNHEGSSFHIGPRDLQLLCEEICQLSAVKHDRKLCDILSRTVLSFKLSRVASDADPRKAQLNASNEKYNKMEYVIEQSVKEIESLNSEIARLKSELEGIESIRNENAKFRRKCNQLLGEVAELRRKLAVASQVANNDDEIRNLEYQLLYGNTEKDKLIASLQKEIKEKDKRLHDESSRNGTCTEESINKWLFEDCDTEYAL